MNALGASSLLLLVLVGSALPLVGTTDLGDDEVGGLIVSVEVAEPSEPMPTPSADPTSDPVPTASPAPTITPPASAPPSSSSGSPRDPLAVTGGGNQTLIGLIVGGLLTALGVMALGMRPGERARRGRAARELT